MSPACLREVGGGDVAATRLRERSMEWWCTRVLRPCTAEVAAAARGGGRGAVEFDGAVTMLTTAGTGRSQATCNRFNASSTFQRPQQQLENRLARPL